jgi:hypothetical protein
MSNADRLRSGHGLPMSDRLVDIRLVEQEAPSTSSHPSLAHPNRWIRSDNIRYTQQGAAFQNSNYVLPTALAPPTSKSKYIPATVLRTLTIRHRLLKPPLHGTGALHRAPQSVRTFTSAANIHQTHVPLDLVVCRQHTQPARNHTTNPTLKPNVVNVSSNTNHHPKYGHTLLRDRPANAPTADPYNPRTYHAGHPLALLNVVPQPPPSAQDLDTALEPSLVRGLHTPQVLAAPRSTTDMGRAADLSTRTDDPNRCDRPSPSHNKA